MKLCEWCGHPFNDSKIKYHCDYCNGPGINPIVLPGDVIELCELEGNTGVTQAVAYVASWNDIEAYPPEWKPDPKQMRTIRL